VLFDLVQQPLQACCFHPPTGTWLMRELPCFWPWKARFRKAPSLISTNVPMPQPPGLPRDASRN